MQKRKAFLLLSLILIASLIAATQESENALDPVTITSSLSPIALSKTGRNIILVKGEQLAQLPVHSIDELLRYLPGLEIQARGPMGVQSDFVIRGGTFQQVLVILDGIRLNDPLTGHFNSYIPIAPAEIERIEVLKGASSALYGSEAVGGVVHIITKTFAAKKQREKKVQAQVAAGQYGLITANAGGFYNNARTAVGGGFLSNNATGQQQRGIKGYLHLNTASISISRQLNEHWQVAVRSAYDHRRFAAQNFYTTFASDTAEERVETIWNAVKTTYQKEKHKLSFDIGYKTAEDEYSFNKSSLSNLNKSRLWQTQAVHQYAISQNSTINSGIQFFNRSIRSNDRGHHNEAQAAAFVLLNQLLHSSFQIAPAFRINWNEQSNIEFVPQMALSWFGKKVQLRGSAGKTIRDADFTERYNNYNRSSVRSGRIGNPDLKAERSFSYEAGGDYFAAKGLKVSATWFQRFHKKLIDWVPTPYAEMPRKGNLVTTGTYALAKNIASVTTSGIETDIQYQHSLSEKYGLWSSVGFIWLDSKSSEAIPSFYITSHARFLTNFSVLFTAPHFQVSLNGIYKQRDEQSAPAINAKVSKEYFLMNTKAEFTFWQKRLGIFTQLDNVFDKEYSDLLGSVMPRRWWQAGARVTL